MSTGGWSGWRGRFRLASRPFMRQPPQAPAGPTGIDYFSLLRQNHDRDENDDMEQTGGVSIVSPRTGCGLWRGRRRQTVVVRAAVSDLDSSRHTVIYLPNTAFGVRGIYTQIVTALGQTPTVCRDGHRLPIRCR